MWPLGLFNNRDQAQEEKRTQPENRQARAPAKLMGLAVSHALQPQDKLRGPKKCNHSPRGKTSKGECFKCKSTSHWAQKCAKNTRVHAQSANKQVTGGGTVPSSKEELFPRWLCWVTKEARGFWQLALMKCLTPSKSLCGP